MILIKDAFLEEIKIGASVSIIVKIKEINGKIISFDDSVVKVKKNDGNIAAISIDSIDYYEFLNTSNLSCEKKRPDIFSILQESGDSFFTLTTSPEVKSYTQTAEFEKNSALYSDLMSISNSLNYAIKQNHESKLTDYKIKENICKLEKIIKNNKDNKTAVNMLAALYYQCSNSLQSLEFYTKGNDNESAFAIAEKINMKNDMERFAYRHFLEDEILNPYILKWLILRTVETKDYSIISKICVSDTNSSKIHGYISFLKAVLIVNNINYDSLLNNKYSVDVLNELINIAVIEKLAPERNMPNHINEVNPSKNIRKIQNPYDLAKKAHQEEKNFEKAEELYLEAIKVNDKAPSAAADLFSLMLQRHEPQKALKYLEQYEPIMKKQTYQNLRKQLERILPDLTPVSQSLNNNQDYYFFEAQKAYLDEKDVQKAITLYKEAIKRKQRLKGSIPDLVSLYTRFKMYDEALELLDKEGKNIDKEKYLNLRASVLSSAKDPKHKNDIIKTYRDIIAISNTIEKKTHYLLSEAVLMNYIGEYKDAINLFQQYKEYDPEKATGQKIFVLLGLCNAYAGLKNNEKVLEYAKEILNLQPDNEFANSVLQGNIPNQNIEDMTGVTNISDYIKYRINKLNLENELKNKDLVKDGIFSGTLQEAKRIIKAISEKQAAISVNDETQSNNYFVIAKIIRHILDREDFVKNSNIFSERNFQLNVAIGSYFYGNYCLFRTENNYSFDTARFCFFETISIFKDSDFRDKCWYTATIRYIETFFCSADSIRKGSKIYYNTQQIEKEYKNKIKEIMQRKLTVPIQNFVVGMLEMLTYNNEVKSFVLSDIFHNIYIDRQELIDVLNKIADEPDNKIIAINEKFFFDFNELWAKAFSQYNIKRKNFLRLIKDTVESVFVFGQLNENFSRFDINEFNNYLNQTDRNYIKDLREIFLNLLKYNEESEFDYKTENFEAAYKKIDRLQEQISENNPTYISYEKLLPLLDHLKSKILREAEQLYKNSEPDISVELLGYDCSVDENFIVRVPIAFKNKNNVQNADNLSIKIKCDDAEVIDDQYLSRRFIAGGKTQEEIIKFRVNEEIIKNQTFSVNIELKYQYKKNMTEPEYENKNFMLSVPLYSSSEFEYIENKFAVYRNGSQVTDASMFFGRDQEIDDIIRQISDKSGNVLKGKCLALYGQTRTGKSSLMYHIERKLREIDPEANVIINVGSIGEENLEGDNISDFLYTLLDTFADEIKKHSKLKTILDENKIEIDSEKILTESEHAQLYFNTVFKKINRCLEEKNCKYNIVIMIDEFTYIYDWIRQSKMTDKIMKFWKALIQNNDIFAVIIGQDHMMNFVKDRRFTNDFGSTDMKKVTYLSEEYAKKLMYEPIMLIRNGEKINRYKEEALDRLYELTAGSAFLIMNLCAGLVDYLNETRTIYVTKAHVDEYLRKNLTSFEEARFFEPQYNDKSNVDNNETILKNKKILRRIAQLSNKKEWASLNSVIMNEDDTKVIDTLKQRDVIIVSNKRCKIKVMLYKEWLNSKYGAENRNE